MLLPSLGGRERGGYILMMLARRFSCARQLQYQVGETKFFNTECTWDHRQYVWKTFAFEKYKLEPTLYIYNLFNTQEMLFQELIVLTLPCV